MLVPTMVSRTENDTKHRSEYDTRSYPFTIVSPGFWDCVPVYFKSAADSFAVDFLAHLAPFLELLELLS